MLVLVSGVLVALASGCGGPGAAGPVSLDGTWPEQPGSYHDVNERWTRHAVLRKYPSIILEVYATFESPEWRAAHASYLAERRNMSNAARAVLLEQTRQVSETAPYEVQLLVTTNDRRENDLTKGKRSVWRVVLVDPQGNEIEPLSIERDRRPREVIAAEFPHLGDFAEPYVARFPRDVALLGPDAAKLSLKMGSARGGVELVWSRK
ncbi:MAG TPA: hypothetical protein VNM90_05740 [Haliangium sp.]|nr:hypothetical protein [Haliangium sp.]